VTTRLADVIRISKIYSWFLVSFVLFSCGSVVGIATGYGLFDREVGVRVTVGSRILSSPYRPDDSGIHPTSFPMGIGNSPG
jgi:hypothetical protein